MGNVTINTIPTVEFLNKSIKDESLEVTSDGFLFVWANRGYAPRSIIVKVNGAEVINYNKVENTNPLRKLILVNKGDILTLTNTRNNGDEFIGLYYYE